MKENEINNYNDKSEKIEEYMTDISNDIEKIKIENERYQDKYDDIFKKLKRTYDNTYKKFDDQRKFLMIEIDQLKSKKKKYTSKLRILEKLQNSDKYNKNSDGLNKNDDNMIEEKEDKKIYPNNDIKNRIKIKRNSTSIVRNIEKKESKLKLKEIKK